MKKIFFILFFTTAALVAQPSTEVFLLDIEHTDDTLKVAHFQNISNNAGYDNQPSFLDDSTLAFAKNNAGQTDIAVYDVPTNKTSYFNTKTDGGEYSPQKVPNSPAIAAVRLDPDGKQRLYRYGANGGNSLLLNGTEVAYYAFLDADRIVASVLANGALDLVVANVRTQEVLPYLENTGRSIHRAPESHGISYTAVNNEKNHEVFTVNFDKDSESYFVCQLPIGVQDYAWLGNSKLIAGSGSALYMYDLFGEGDWELAINLKDKNITNITRLSVSPNGKKLALAAEYFK
ncbi:MAG: TolB family protein [Marinirhabdus sp.]